MSEITSSSGSVKTEYMQRLKPVTFVQGKYNYHRQNTAQQALLLKAMTYTKDPKKLRDLIGVKTVADVWRTLDKMALRKEYHAALSKNGISFEYIIGKIKQSMEHENASSADILKGAQTFLKSVGMDKYDGDAVSGGSWEDLILQQEEERKKIANTQVKEATVIEDTDYEVVTPKIPDAVVKAKQEEQDLADKLYG